MAEQRKQFLWEDGRRAEQVVIEDDGCEGVSVTELYVEPKIEKKLAQRITEKRKPYIYERAVERIDESTGEIVEKTIEGTENGPQLRVLERQLAQPLMAQSESVGDCSVTREELRQDIIDAIAHLGRVQGGNEVVAAQSVIEDRLENKSSNATWINVALLGVVSALAAGLAWSLFM